MDVLVRPLGGDLDGTPIVVFPHAGAGISAMSALVRSLPPGFAAFGVQTPGREDRLNEQSSRGLEDLAAQCAIAIDQIVRTPCVLFGHSLGGLLAWETGRRLETPPELVVISGSDPPNTRPSHLPEALDDVALAQWMIELGGVPEGLRNRPELLSLFLPTLRADIEMASAYICNPVPVPDFPILALAGTDDAAASEQSMRGWRNFSAGKFKSSTCPGGHFFVLTSPTVVGAHIEEWMFERAVGT